MPKVVLYFQVHQPFRIRNYSFFNIGNNHQYEAVNLNYELINRIADKCYLPANEILLDMIKLHGEDFGVTFSVSGTALEQFENYRPDVIESFRALIATGRVEFCAETYYHSLASVYSEKEFGRQVKLHKAKLKELFGYSPTVFRNTELIYSDKVAEYAKKLGFKTIICEQVGRNTNSNSYLPTVFKANGVDAKLLSRHSNLSDDVAFRFTESAWPEYPLTAEKYASWLWKYGEEAEVVTLGMDYETFGEHRPLESGILQFLHHLPKALGQNTTWKFTTASEAVKNSKAETTYTAAEFTSWADEARDISGWVENHMQQDALNKVYKLEDKVLASKNTDLIHTWGKLQTSDHFYYMSTRYWGDGIREFFSPYKSPYDAYLNYMNVLSDFEKLLK